MTVYQGPCSYGNVIHVNATRGTKEFVLSYKWREDMVHHGLECCGGVCEAKKHDEGFAKSVACFEGCFMFITFFDAYVVVPSSNVEFGIDVCAA